MSVSPKLTLPPRGLIDSISILCPYGTICALIATCLDVITSRFFPSSPLCLPCDSLSDEISLID